MKYVDLTGKVFARLTVVKRVVAPGRVKYLCTCECGGSKVVRGDHLSAGGTRSCGCMQDGKTDGQYKTKTYSSWQAMMQRCENPNAPRFENYGGRGIKICERWHEFENFHADMGNRPEGKTLDRKMNDGNYEKCNCRWATPTEQARNRRGNRHVEVNGEVMTMSAAAEVLSVKLTTLKYQLDRMGV